MGVWEWFGLKILESKNRGHDESKRWRLRAETLFLSSIPRFLDSCFPTHTRPNPHTQPPSHSNCNAANS
jgi:hypothetical protein